MYVIDNIVCSDHFPLCIDINCNINPICDSNYVIHTYDKCNWKLAEVLEKYRYNLSTGKVLSAIDVLIDAVLYRDANCRVHIHDIDVFL